MQTTSRELGSDGIAVRCKRPPRTGARVSMALYLPGTSKPEVAVGVVGASDAARATFWADFLVLDTEARNRIDSLLAQRQQEPRQLDVSFPTAREFVVEYAKNLSKGGVFVEMPEPPPLSTLVEVRMRLPDGGPTLISPALVVHRSLPDDAARRGGRPGAGVQFIGARRALQARFDLYLERLAAGPAVD